MNKASRKSLRHSPRQITVLLPESSWYRTSRWPQRHGVKNHANALKCTELRLNADLGSATDIAGREVASFPGRIQMCFGREGAHCEHALWSNNGETQKIDVL